MRGTIVRALLWLLVAAVPAFASDSFERGVDAYRRGAYAEAEAHWRATLTEPLAPDDRAQVAYDLGNAVWRQGRAIEAIGWYRVALAHAPRHADARANMELARSEAGLEPDDRGDLRSTVERLLGLLRPAEARRLATLALALFALALLFEALVGGRAARRVAWTAFLVTLPMLAPWLHTRWGHARDPVLVVRAPSVALRSEPRRELSPTARVDAGAELERIDALSGWVRVETPDGVRGWLQEGAVFALNRESP